MAKKPKPSKAELLDRDIARWHRAQERALVMGRKAERLLKRSAIEIARLHKRRGKVENVYVEAAPDMASEAARAAAEVPAPAAVVERVPLERLGETEVGRANAESWNEIPAVAKAKRKRKPKADNGSAAISTDDPDLVEKVGAALEASRKESVDRNARMKAMGFRKTTKQRKLTNVTSS